jgi:hypothetical protein
MQKALVPAPLPEPVAFSMDMVRAMKWQAEVLMNSGFVPRHLTKASQIIAVMMMADELGIRRTLALRNMYVIDGKVSCEAKLMLALARRTGELEAFDVKATSAAAVCSITRKGYTPVTEEFTIEDARAMGLTEGGRGANYKKQPKVMLRWRAISACLQLTFSDVLMGMYTPDELGAPVRIVDGEVVLDTDDLPDNEGEVRDDIPESDDAEPEPEPVTRVRAPKPVFENPKPLPKIKPKRKLHPTQEAVAEKPAPVEQSPGRATKEQREALRTLYLTTYADKTPVITPTERTQYNEKLRSDGSFAYWDKLTQSVARLVTERVRAAAAAAKQDAGEDDGDDEWDEDQGAERGVDDDEDDE